MSASQCPVSLFACLLLRSRVLFAEVFRLLHVQLASYLPHQPSSLYLPVSSHHSTNPHKALPVPRSAAPSLKTQGSTTHAHAHSQPRPRSAVKQKDLQMQRVAGWWVSERVFSDHQAIAHYVDSGVRWVLQGCGME
ncbi:hypothetical protein BS50DRAFT_594255 [Corynespora cassiicola Philippines]|uniref:Secreted protein n=1 Tax=Corynespora cassiicola Philippines TaxID=1448308 RepID=A0A2T2N2Z4_CORCC|nr:hypothetical protein BS50DRAFT_594255 [Corynespora cassiicola Philippines]